MQLCHLIYGNQLVATAKTLSKKFGAAGNVQDEVVELTIETDGQDDDDGSEDEDHDGGEENGDNDSGGG